MSEESWRPVDGFVQYEVSNLGRVRSRRARGPSVMLKPSIGWTGYASVVLTKDRRQHRRLVHRLVAAAFIGPIAEGFDVSHKDHARLNNVASNLEICEHVENVQQSDGRPRKIPVMPFSASEVRELRRLYAEGKITAAKIAADRNQNYQSVLNMLNGRTYKRVA